MFDWGSTSTHWHWTFWPFTRRYWVIKYQSPSRIASNSGFSSTIKFFALHLFFNPPLKAHEIIELKNLKNTITKSYCFSIWQCRSLCWSSHFFSPFNVTPLSKRNSKWHFDILTFCIKIINNNHRIWNFNMISGGSQFFQFKIYSHYHWKLQLQEFIILIFLKNRSKKF